MTLFPLAAAQLSCSFDDSRNIGCGTVISDTHDYYDQPYCVTKKVDTEFGTSILCVLTTGVGEGGRTQFTASTVSDDLGKTWSNLTNIEPVGPPEASWAMPVVTDSGRVYTFYDYNSENITFLPEDPNTTIRADMLGHLVFKYSDDWGETWSDERYEIPMQKTFCDERNQWMVAGQDVFVGWGVGKPTVFADGSVTLGFTKICKYFLDDDEAVFYRSPNLLSVDDPSDATWELLPHYESNDGQGSGTGQDGMRAFGPNLVNEEGNLLPMSDESHLLNFWRTIDGFMGFGASQDGGKTWKDGRFAHMSVSTDGSTSGRVMKQPRGPITPRRFSNGNFVMTYYVVSEYGVNGFGSRNPMWVTGAKEQKNEDGTFTLNWSEPEVLLFSESPEEDRIGYPDFIEIDGGYWITQTQKSIASINKVDDRIFEGLWNPPMEVASEGLLVDAAISSGESVIDFDNNLPNLSEGGGLTYCAWIDVKGDLLAGEILFDSRNNDVNSTSGVYMSVSETGNNLLAFGMSNGTATFEHHANKDCGGINVGEDVGLTHFCAIADGLSGAGFVYFTVNGEVCDGGDESLEGGAKKGFAHISGAIAGTVNGKNDGITVGVPANADLVSLRVYNRALRSAEATGNYRAGL